MKIKQSMHTKHQPLIGFIGQGFIGKNYADDFEARGYEVIRYGLEAPYTDNKEALQACDIVFIAVPTPTTPTGYDIHIIRDVIPLTRKGATVVLKSTILPGLTRTLQREFPDHIIMHSPEFLSEATAAIDAAHPFSNIVGITSTHHTRAAKAVHAILPPAAYAATVSAEEAELIKYAHNIHGFFQIIFSNLLYDLAEQTKADWRNIHAAVYADPYIAHTYMNPVHKSGRGAGGHCFIKDMAAFREIYERMTGDVLGVQVLRSLEEKNKMLLTESGKDTELLRGVYGETFEQVAESLQVSETINR